MSAELETKVPNEDKEDEDIEDVPTDPNKMTPQDKLFYFAKRGDAEGIKEVSNQTDINAVDFGSARSTYKSQNTAMHYAVLSGDLQCVKVLFSLQAKMDSTNKLGSTPLHIAASLGLTDIVEFLLAQAADINAKNAIQNTPLHCAVYAGHVDTVKAILQKVDKPQEALLERNGVGMGAAKYTAHEPMKAYLRTYFPPKNKTDLAEKQNDDHVGDNDDEQAQTTQQSNDVEEEPPSYED